MMDRNIVLTESDHEKLREMLRWYERNKNLRHQLRRRNISGGGFLIRRAKTTQAAPADTKITANLLDNDGAETTVAIDVYCDTVPTGTNLDKVIPQFPDDFEFTVYRSQGKWFCPAIFHKIDSDQLQVDATDGLQIKLDKCPLG